MNNVREIWQIMGRTCLAFFHVCFPRLSSHPISLSPFLDSERRAKEAEVRIRDIARRAREEHRRTTSFSSPTSPEQILTTQVVNGAFVARTPNGGDSLASGGVQHTYVNGGMPNGGTVTSHSPGENFSTTPSRSNGAETRDINGNVTTSQPPPPPLPNR